MYIYTHIYIYIELRNFEPTAAADLAREVSARGTFRGPPAAARAPDVRESACEGERRVCEGVYEGGRKGHPVARIALVMQMRHSNENLRSDLSPLSRHSRLPPPHTHTHPSACLAARSV